MEGELAATKGDDRMTMAIERFERTQTRTMVVNPTATAEFFMPSRLLQVKGLGLDQAYANLGWVHAIVSAIARNIAGVPFLIKTGDEREPITLRDGQWVDLFDNPNPYMQSRSQLWEAICIWMEMSGECMVVKEGKGDARLKPGEIPAELWPVNGKFFDPIIDPRTQLSTHWAQRDGKTGETIFWHPHELIHLKFYNPYDPLRGLAPWRSAEAAARTDATIARYTEMFFENDATPGGILISEGELTEHQIKQIRKGWEDRQQGLNKRQRVAVLEGGMDWKSIGATNKDSEMLPLRNASLNELLAVFKVPKTEVALHENLNFATAQSADRGFWIKTLIPLMKLIEDGLWSQLFDLGRAQQRKVGHYLERSRAALMVGRSDPRPLTDPFDLDQGPSGVTPPATPGDIWGEFDIAQIESLRDNLDVKATTAQRLIQLGYPLNLVNDRLQLGMPSVTWGDEPPQQAGMFPPGSEAAPSIPGSEGSPNNGDPFQLVNPMAAPAAPGAAKNPFQLTLAAPQGYAHTRQTPRGGRAAAARRLQREVMEPMENAFRGKFRRYLMEYRAEALRLFRSASRSADDIQTRAPVIDIEGALPNEKEWADRARSMHHVLYVTAGEKAIESAKVELGGKFKFDEADPRVLDAIARREEIMATSVSRTIRQRLAREIEAGVKANETIGQIADRIRTSFNAFSGPRALMVARTEMANTVNQVRNQVFEEEGIEQHEWMTANDEAVRESHRQVNGEIRKIGEPFSNGLMFPGDPSGAAEEVINCRCIAVAVV